MGGETSLQGGAHMKGAVLLFCALATVAEAGTIVLRTGSIPFDDPVIGDGPVTLVGNRGFVFRGNAQLASVFAADCSFGCDPGETVSLNVRVSGNDLSGIAFLDTTQYGDVGGPGAPESLDLEINGTDTVPTTTTLMTRVRATQATLTGTFYHGMVLAPEKMTAPCMAVLTWDRVGDIWFLDRIEYDVVRR